MVLALYYLSFPEMMTSQPLAPALSFMTALMMELAASLTGIYYNNFILMDSTWAEAHNPLAVMLMIPKDNCSG